MYNNLNGLVLLIALCGSSLPAPAASKRHSAPDESTGTVTAILWRAPAEIASRELFYGPGGRKDEPHAPFRFIEEERKGFNPKFTVRDREGVKWTVKLGLEARPDTAATRLLFAAGYFAPEDYLLPELRVAGLPPHLRRGQEFVGRDGVIRNARLKRAGIGPYKKAGSWEWRSNPFAGTKELNGLRVMMALINNWDLKDENNAIYEARDGSDRVTQVYLVSDLGSSFGTTGLSLTQARSKDDFESFRKSTFIGKVVSDSVDFGSPSRPNLLRILIDPPYFFAALRLRWIGKRIPRQDARWIGQVLSHLSPDQLRAVFRAAGYSPQEGDAFAGVLERRIAALNEL